MAIAAPQARLGVDEGAAAAGPRQHSPDAMEIWGNASTYNMNTALIQCIRTGEYWNRAMADDEITVPNMIDEIYMNVHHLEPFTSKNPHLVASTAFCCLYKLLTMRLTPAELTTMITHKDSPYIRAVGFLYLRLVCEPKNLWSWFRPYVSDKAALTVAQRGQGT